jgi:hypothetical protein
VRGEFGNGCCADDLGAILLVEVGCDCVVNKAVGVIKRDRETPASLW